MITLIAIWIACGLFTVGLAKTVGWVEFTVTVLLGPIAMIIALGGVIRIAVTGK